MKVILQTDRLTLKEFTLADASFIIELVNTPGWLTYIGDRNVHDEEQAQAYLTNGPLKSYRENGFGLWCVTLREEEIPVGMCGLLQRDYLNHPDIGFAFLPEFHGKGYAHEAARAVVAYAKDLLQLAAICAITLPSNDHSIRLLEKIGMHQEGHILVPTSNEKLLLYHLPLTS